MELPVVARSYIPTTQARERLQNYSTTLFEVLKVVQNVECSAVCYGIRQSGSGYQYFNRSFASIFRVDGCSKSVTPSIHCAIT